ncbi:Transcriptional regulator [Seminavis robusta]|uniref:Transcriptional regulator n=1 Tax=Seminavis robusta TaxID=568900 RepID=A0A9N8DDS5_9STRA|nr:Transcriptional regulator [Seminavis robusta]|eukprot:Sro92_g048130.1 Transcriptional regulator (1262) ;mRNA; r:63542-67508
MTESSSMEDGSMTITALRKMSAGADTTFNSDDDDASGLSWGTGNNSSYIKRLSGIRGSLNTVGRRESMKEFAQRSQEFKSEIKILANSFERKMSVRYNNVTKEFSVNKLQFHRLELVGRENEKEILKERLFSLNERVLQDQAEQAARPFSRAPSEMRTSLTNGRFSSSRSSLANADQARPHSRSPSDMRTSLKNGRFSSSRSTLANGERNHGSPGTMVGHRELIMITGVSGSGKSALAQTLEDHLNQQKMGVLVRGKFDLKAAEEPYSTIISACHDLGVKILKLAGRMDGLDENGGGGARSNKQSYREIRDQLRRELVGMELQMLVHTIPILGDILMDRVDLDLDDMDQSNYTTGELINRASQLRTSQQGSNRSRGVHNSIQMGTRSGGGGGPMVEGQTQEMLESAFRKFFRTISFFFAPLVLVLDDLQWSDIRTLELLKLLLSDTTNPHLMVVGCYRSDEVEETHNLAQVVRDLKHDSQNIGLTVTELHIGNLTPTDSNEIVMTLLNIDDQAKTQELSDLCHQRTMGNPFFFLMYVEMLNRDGLLTFNLGTFCWEWDISKIKAATGATANVVDLMTEKFLKQSKELVHLLKLACCLGNIFTGAVLFLVWAMSPDVIKANDEGTAKDELFHQLLEESIEEKFLERCDEGLRWTHDKVQEAAMMLEPQEDFEARKYKVGHTLYTCLDGEDLEEYLFCIVNLLNEGSAHRSAELAELNLRAAKKAKIYNAVSLQSMYSELGIANLPNDCWTSCKDLALELHIVRAEAASSMGEFQTMEQNCNVVFSQKECSVLDTIPCHKVWIHKFARHGNYQEALKLEINVLEKLGCRIPRRQLPQALTAISTLLRFKRKLKEITPTAPELQKMPLMTDPVHKNAMSLLASFILHAYVTQNSLLWLLGTIRMVHLTLEHGLADQSQLAFSSAGVMIMHALGDWEMGKHYATLALKMHDKLEERSHRSSTMCASHGLVIAWMHPMQGQLRWMMEGYKRGMQLGDIEWAFSNITVYVEMGLISGLQLHGLSDDIRIYLSQFESMSTNGDYSRRTRLIWQTAMNLMGESESTTLLCGSAISEDYLLEETSTISGTFSSLLKSFLCVHFGDHEKGAALALKRGNSVYELSPGHPLGMVDPFLRAMSLYAMARKSKKSKSKYQRHANKARKAVKAWLKKGNPNVYHQLELLNAERAALSMSQDTNELYYKAARLAVRGGWIHDAALASERHAEYMLEQHDKEGATSKLEEAVERYSTWGATKKVSQLQDMYSDLLDF